MYVFFAAIRALASKLVEQWLKTVKGEQVVPIQLSNIPQIISEAQSESELYIKSDCDAEQNSNESVENNKNSENRVKLEKPNNVHMNQDKVTDDKIKETDVEPEALPVLKISLKDGKQVISQVDDDSESKTSDIPSDSERSKEKKNRSKDKSDEKSSSARSSSSSKHSSRSHSSSDKHRSSHKSSSSRHSSSKDRSKDKDRHSSHSSKSKSDSSRKSSDKSSSSSSKSKEDRSSRSTSDRDKGKEKLRDDKSEKSKDKSTSDKSDEKTPSVHKLGKIPKLSDSKKEKLSISIEVRKPDEPKPKTVKTFHSKFRKHGLEEEVKPPPSRAAVLTKKSTPILPPTVSIPKRSSPAHNDSPPEKKPKIVEPVEKPGSIKLIPPKHKRKYFTIFLKLNMLLIVSFFPDFHWSWQLLRLITPSFLNYLGSFIVSGKSKMYNLTGSKVFLLPVKYFFLINIEFNMNLSV